MLPGDTFSSKLLDLLAPDSLCNPLLQCSPRLGKEEISLLSKNKRKFKNKAISELLYNPEMLLWVYIQRKCKWCFQRASAHTDSTQHWSQQLKHGIIKHPSLINGKRHIEKTYIGILLSHTKQGKPVIVTTCLELDITKLSKIVQ